jgi:ubiquinone/menaquinone biosynthesis C-methylase UbiE
MSSYKALIKDLFYRTKLVSVLDKLLFEYTRFVNRRKNESFRKLNPGLIIPPDYYLYETYRLNYEEFFKDGEQTAKEIISWTSKYLGQNPLKILDWGCGVSRIVMHVQKFTNDNSAIYACDINEEMISFNKMHYKNVLYSLVAYQPPLTYDSGYFDLVYGLSIFTHIEAVMQFEWVKELYRILGEGGILLFTTQGRFFNPKLLKHEMRLLQENGVYSKAYGQKGHRMMSTYNDPESFRKLLEDHFEILEFHDGATDQTKMGGQDLWIARKKPAAVVLS